jgi:hypothetical protein
MAQCCTLNWNELPRPVDQLYPTGIAAEALSQRDDPDG